MNKRQHQLNDYLCEQHSDTDYNIDTIKSRIDNINEEIRRLDNDRFFLTLTLFNLQNRKMEEDGDE